MIQRIREEMEKEGIDCLILTDHRNMEWAFGKELSGYAFVTQEKVSMILPRFYIHGVENIDAEVSFAFRKEDYTELLEEKSEKVSGNVAADQVSEKLEDLFDAEETEIVTELRMIKTEEEVEKIRKACETTDRAFENLRPELFTGIDEFEAVEKLREVYAEEGVLESFLTNESQSIVQANCLEPHRPPEKRMIEKEDLVIVDTGARYDNYCADVTRTFCDDPNHEKRQVYEDALELQQYMIDQIEPGLDIRELVEMKNRKARELGYDPEKHLLYFGHGVGVEVHEMPKLAWSSERKLKKGMVVTVEPGLTVSKTGGARIEDVVHVTEDGCEVLSSYPLEL